MNETPKGCICQYYIFAQWRSHSPDFPFKDWDVVERHDFQVGTHAEVDVFEGKAACKKCGKIYDFFCTYGDGYGFNG